MSAPRPDKTKPDADQKNDQLKDLNNAGYNRFRALKKDQIDFQDKLHSLREFESKPFVMDLLSKQFDTNRFKNQSELVDNTYELEFYLQGNPLVSLNDIHFKKKQRKSIKESLSELINIKELTKPLVTKRKIEPESSNVASELVIETNNIKKEKFNNNETLPKAKIVEINLCSSDSECEQSSLKALKAKKLTNVQILEESPVAERISSNVNILSSQVLASVSETQGNFIDNELEMNIIPNENNIEALLDHFSDESVVKSNNDESMGNVGGDDETSIIIESSIKNKPNVMTNIENTLVSKLPELSSSSSSSYLTLNSSNEHFDFFTLKLQEIFQKKIDKLKNNDPVKKRMSKSNLETLVLDINHEVLRVLNPKGDTYKKYYNKMCKIKNMIDPEYNQHSRFYYRILSGHLTPEKLAKMTEEELKLENAIENESISLEDESNDLNDNSNNKNNEIMPDEDDVPLRILSKSFVNANPKPDSQEKTIAKITSGLNDQPVTSNFKPKNSCTLETSKNICLKTSEESIRKVVDKINQEKPKSIFVADSTDEEECNDDNDGALQDSDEDEDHSVSIPKQNPYFWCVCGKGQAMDCDMCEQCKSWYHKECDNFKISYNEEQEFYCFACQKDIPLIKKHLEGLKARNHPNVSLINEPNHRTNGEESFSSDEHSSDSGKIIKKKTKRNQLLDSSSSSKSDISNESFNSISTSSSSSSSESDSESKPNKQTFQKKITKEKSFKSTPRIEISDLNVNIKNADKQVNQLKSTTIQDKSKETTKLNDKERIEKVKNNIKPANQTKLMSSSDSMMNKKKNRHLSDSNTKSTISSGQPGAMKASLSGTNLNAKKNFTVTKIQQDYLNRKKNSGFDDLFFKSSSTNSNKEIKKSTPIISKPNLLNSQLNKNNNKVAAENSSTSTAPKLNAQISKQPKTIITQSTMPSQNRPPVPQGNTFEDNRAFFKRSLIEKLKHKMEKNPGSPPLFDAELDILVSRIENELYKHFNPNLKSYKSQYRQIIQNVVDAKNNSFYLKILTKKKGYTPEDLPKMNNDDMASDERIAERQKERQNDIEQRINLAEEINRNKAQLLLKNSEKGLPQIFVDEELLQNTKNNEQPKLLTKNNETDININKNQNLDTETPSKLNISSESTEPSPVLLQEKKIVTSPLLTSNSIDFFTQAISYSLITETRQHSFSNKDTTHQHANHSFDINCKVCRGELPLSSLTSSTNQCSSYNSKSSISASNSSISLASIMESKNSPAQLFNINSSSISNESSGRKNDKDQEEKNRKNLDDINEKNSPTESHNEKTNNVSTLKEKIAPSSTIKNKFDFNINSEKPQSTETQKSLENNQINVLKNVNSVLPASPTAFNDDLNHSPRCSTGNYETSNNNESNLSNLPEKERISLIEWMGYIELSNLSLFVKGYPLCCPKNEKFYLELKEKFLNKNLLKLKQAHSTSGCQLQIYLDENSKNKASIYEFFKSIRQERELIFIRFEADKTSKSKINLAGGNNWQPCDSDLMYKSMFDLFHAQRSFINIHIPTEHANFLEDFYLFALKKKDPPSNNQQLGPEIYFLNTHNIKLVRKADYVMGVIIRKARFPEMNCRKRKENSIVYPLDEDISKRPKTSFSSITDTSLNHISSNISVQRSVSVISQESSQPLTRDPRLLQRLQSQKPSFTPDGSPKDMPLVSLPPSSSLTPIPELAKETTNKILNDPSQIGLISENSLSKSKAPTDTNTNLEPFPTQSNLSSLNDAIEKIAETIVQSTIVSSASNNQVNETIDEKSTYENLIDALDLIIALNDKDPANRQELLEGVKSTNLLDDITDEEREKILNLYKDKLPEFVFIILDSSKNETFKAKSFQKLLEKKLPPAEKWLGTSREQVLERLQVHKSGVNISLENENWKQTKRSFELVEPSYDLNNEPKFKNTFQTVRD